MAKQTVDNRKLQDAIGVKIERIQKGFYESYEREARNILMAIAQEGVKKIKEYIKTLGIKYDTYGKTRSFKSTTGKNINVIGGNYGWRIDRTKEKEALIKNIKSGEVIKKEPYLFANCIRKS